MPWRLVLFDVDGVLLDSLGPHLQICRDLRERFGLPRPIPDEEAFKALVRAGVPVSPMAAFFAAVGFPAASASEATRVYEETFLARYAPAPFPEVEDVLGALHARGVDLGLVTANVRANVWAALGRSAAFLRADCVFTQDGPDAFTSKALALTEALRRTGLSPAEVLFVGDQPADEAAARTAGVAFLGAGYGWGFEAGPGRLARLGDLLAL